LAKDVRRQLGLSQEDMAHALGGELCHGDPMGEWQDNAVAKVDSRTPQEIIENIEALGEIVVAALARLKTLLVERD
jgi:hypothetical protein